MRKRVRIGAVHPELVPDKLAKELRAVADDVQDCLQVLELPNIIINIRCDFREKPRHFAAVETGNPTILYLCPDLEDEPITSIRGIFYHEMGHILQWVEKSITGSVEKHGRDYEQDADHKVEGICGIKLYYNDMFVQQAGPGASGIRPRPRGLK